jgi:hypothetical protein
MRLPRLGGKDQGRGRLEENGGKWRKMEENGGKWRKMKKNEGK